MSQALIVNAISGETVEREFTADEIAQREVDAAADAERLASEEKASAEALAVRDAAIAHAKSLGFTDAMIAVMYPGLAG